MAISSKQPVEPLSAEPGTSSSAPTPTPSPAPAAPIPAASPSPAPAAPPTPPAPPQKQLSDVPRLRVVRVLRDTSSPYGTFVTGEQATIRISDKSLAAKKNTFLAIE